MERTRTRTSGFQQGALHGSAAPLLCPPLTSQEPGVSKGKGQKAMQVSYGVRAYLALGATARRHRSPRDDGVVSQVHSCSFAVHVVPPSSPHRHERSNQVRCSTLQYLAVPPFTSLVQCRSGHQCACPVSPHFSSPSTCQHAKQAGWLEGRRCCRRTTSLTANQYKSTSPAVAQTCQARAGDASLLPSTSNQYRIGSIDEPIP
jgi:hypothetical protein